MPFFTQTQDDRDSLVVVEHCSHRSLAFIFEFLNYHHAREPHFTIAQDFDDDDGEQKRNKSKLDWSKCGNVSLAEKAGTHAKDFNSKWFQRVVAADVDSLHDTVRAAHFLHNEYLFRVLISGCETLILQGSLEHVRLFLQLGCSLSLSKRQEKEDEEQEQRILPNRKRKFCDICFDAVESEWIEWNSATT